MPRWLALVTYALAVILLLGISLSLWFNLIFPTWVFGISVFLLVGNLRKRSASVEISP